MFQCEGTNSGDVAREEKIEINTFTVSAMYPSSLRAATSLLT